MGLQVLKPIQYFIDLAFFGLFQCTMHVGIFLPSACHMRNNTWENFLYDNPGYQDAEVAQIPGMTVNDWSYVAADPSGFDGFDAYVKAPNLTPYAETEAKAFHGSPHCRQEDLFSRLPVEINLIILKFLPSNDICKLRLASRVAQISTVDVLPQSFWSSRFGPGFEMQFAFPRSAVACRARHNRTLNWREIYFAVKRALHSPNSFAPLKNRKRIWTAIDVLSQLIELLLINHGRRGIPTAWNDMSSVSVVGGSLDICIGRVIQGDSISEIHRYVHSNTCRELEVRSLICLQLPQPDGYTIGISSISLDHGIFVSGVRIIQHHVRIKGTHGPNSLGLVNEAFETLIHVKSSDVLEGFEVAVCARGIVGLTPVIRDLNCPHSGFSANPRNWQPGVSFGRLRPRPGKQIFALVAGLDVRISFHNSIPLILCGRF